MTAIDIGLPAIIVPGLGGSEPEHWQSLFERSIPNAIRLSGLDWDCPQLPVWTASLLRAVERQPNSVLIAHSIGCALIAHVARRHRYLPVAGAMLVAPADVDASPIIPESLRSFARIPTRKLPFPSIVVASSNDPYMTADRAQFFASTWGAHLINIGAAGHINVAAGFGSWPEGQRILHEFTAGLAAPVAILPNSFSHPPERT